MNEQLFYEIANSFFFVFHIGLILFNLFGWIPKSFRKWNLVSLGLTAFSWFVLGIFYGFGYCFLTEWHWQIRERLGYTVHSNSYVHFIITELTDISITEDTVDICTAGLFFSALTVSLVVNIRDKKRSALF